MRQKEVGQLCPFYLDIQPEAQRIQVGQGADGRERCVAASVGLPAMWLYLGIQPGAPWIQAVWG